MRLMVAPGRYTSVVDEYIECAGTGVGGDSVDCGLDGHFVGNVQLQDGQTAPVLCSETVELLGTFRCTAGGEDVDIALL